MLRDDVYGGMFVRVAGTFGEFTARVIYRDMFTAGVVCISADPGCDAIEGKRYGVLYECLSVVDLAPAALSCPVLDFGSLA